MGWRDKGALPEPLRNGRFENLLLGRDFLIDLRLDLLPGQDAFEALQQWQRDRPAVCLSGVVSVPPDGEMIMETDAGPGCVQPDVALLAEFRGWLDRDGATRVYAVACGAAWHAALIGRYLIEEWARLTAEAEIASRLGWLNKELGNSGTAQRYFARSRTSGMTRAMRESGPSPSS